MTPPSDRQFRHCCQVRVRYAETDTMGVVYYANYLTYFEVARVEYLRAIGASYRDLEASGVIAAVTEARCRYVAPARFDDLLTLRTRIARLRRASLTFEYQVWRDADARLLAEGTTEHACLDRETLRSVPVPEQLRQAILALEGTTPLWSPRSSRRQGGELRIKGDRSLPSPPPAGGTKGG